MAVPNDRAALAELLADAGFVAADEEADELLARAAGDVRAPRGARRAPPHGRALAWITGTVSFCGLEIRVDRGVYVPRWQSEPLARRAAQRLPANGVAIDLCTGAGAIARTLMAAQPGARVVASDLDERAVACATANGVEAHHGDLFAPLPQHAGGDASTSWSASCRTSRRPTCRCCSATPWPSSRRCPTTAGPTAPRSCAASWPTARASCAAAARSCSSSAVSRPRRSGADLAAPGLRRRQRPRRRGRRRRGIEATLADRDRSRAAQLAHEREPQRDRDEGGAGERAGGEARQARRSAARAPPRRRRPRARQRAAARRRAA